jgi:5-methylcytosine-specific restriction endonuclease McrA
MAKPVVCKACGTNGHYQTFCPYKKRKPIPKRGKHAKKWETFRDTVAKPYLDAKYGRVCSKPGCSETTNLDVDHIKKRGSNPQLRYELTNLRYLCRPHHIEETDRLYWSKK